MIILLSPSKGQDFEPNSFEEYSEPELIKDSRVLVSILKKYSSQEIQKLMSISENLAELNEQRYKDFKTPFDLANAKQAVLAFKGDVYSGLDASSLSAKDLGFAQQHLRILSGLYGSLRPLDLIQAYRLEMKTRLPNKKGINLYQYWGDKITRQINDDLTQLDYRHQGFFINLIGKL
ncbi:MAG: peroxide stress protein YaaA [Proteobacteria bacterium]|nr:peroxide stress protein YaaA [Pseudomonadota bacterium]